MCLLRRIAISGHTVAVAVRMTPCKLQPKVLRLIGTFSFWPALRKVALGPSCNQAFWRGPVVRLGNLSYELSRTIMSIFL